MHQLSCVLPTELPNITMTLFVSLTLEIAGHLVTSSINARLKSI